MQKEHDADNDKMRTSYEATPKKSSRSILGKEKKEEESSSIKMKSESSWTRSSPTGMGVKGKTSEDLSLSKEVLVR